MNTQEMLSELRRNLENMIMPGTVHSVDGILCRVAIEGDPKNLTPSIPWITGRAASQSNWSQPDEGEQAIVLSPGGDYGKAVALVGLYSDANPSPSEDPDEVVVKMPDGAVLNYNHADSVLTLTLPAGGSMDIVADAGTTLTGDLHVGGNITATGDVSDGARSMQGDRDIYNSHTGHGVGGTPSQQQ